MRCLRWPSQCGRTTVRRDGTPLILRCFGEKNDSKYSDRLPILSGRFPNTPSAFGRSEMIDRPLRPLPEPAPRSRFPERGTAGCRHRGVDPRWRCARFGDHTAERLASRSFPARTGRQRLAALRLAPRRRAARDSRTRPPGLHRTRPGELTPALASRRASTRRQLAELISLGLERASQYSGA